MMENLELRRHVTIGQYVSTSSPLHHMDPRFKLVAFVALVLAVTFTDSYLGNAALLALMGGLIVLSRVPARYVLGGLRPALPILLLLAALQILLYAPDFTGEEGCTTLVRAWFVHSTTCSVKLAVVSAARFVELLVLTSLLTLTTTTTGLTHGVEHLLAPLQRRLGFPAHELALTLTITLRFVPTFAEELERLIKAQVSRGADLGGHSRLRAVRRAQALLPVLVPLLLGALRRAEMLTVAMQARGYVGGRGRTRFVQLHSTPRDAVALCLALLAAVAIVVLPWPW
ncbi:MAG: energy-coupling factor transporter transmembrane protein EcfT [Ardenticatenia bacterium]|nr:energy-coupling factor transporter transmembrane protein EcfT [Ardenticatenia bacterium]